MRGFKIMLLKAFLLTEPPRLAEVIEDLIVQWKYSFITHSFTGWPMRCSARCKVLCHNLCVVIQSVHELVCISTYRLNQELYFPFCGGCIINPSTKLLCSVPIRHKSLQCCKAFH